MDDTYHTRLWSVTLNPMETLTAQQAIERLKIKPATLYSYVSRGLIRTEPDPQDPRRKRYLAADIDRLTARRDAAPEPFSAMPSLFAALNEDAEKWAARACFEAAATRLWQQTTPWQTLFAQPLPPIPPESHGLPSIHALMTALVIESAYDVRAYDLSPDGVAFTAARILRLMADVLSGGATGDRIAHQLATAWRTNPTILDSALILLADESPPEFETPIRAVRAQRTPPYAAIQTGLALLTGLTQANQAAAAGLLREIAHPDHAHTVIARRLRHNLPIAGFHLPPITTIEGERRTPQLIALARTAYPDSAPLMDAVIDAARYAINARPSLSFALAALEVAGRLPDGAGLGLFALARAATWLRP